MADEKVRFELKADVHQQTVNHDGKEITIGKEGLETDDGGLVAALDATPGVKRTSTSGKSGGKSDS